MRTHIALVAATLAICVGATACGSDSEWENGGSVADTEETAIEYDEKLASTIVGMSKRGETRRLAELTRFAWERVYVYAEGASAEQIASDVGSDVLSEKFYYEAGNLFVFIRDGEVLRAVSVVPDLLTWAGSNAFGPGATLTPAHPGKQPRLLRIHEPNA